MSKIINLGRILPVFHGNWSSEKTYENLDVVYYVPDNTSYVAKQTTRGEIPTNSNSWVPLCKGGSGSNTSSANTVTDGGTIHSLTVTGEITTNDVVLNGASLKDTIESINTRIRNVSSSASGNNENPFYYDEVGPYTTYPDY